MNLKTFSMVVLTLMSSQALSDDRTEGLSSLIINEVMTANVDAFVDPSWNYGSWIEVYNPTDNAIELQDCWLTDNPALPFKARVLKPVTAPAHGFVNLWFEHCDVTCPTQIDMKLDLDGGTIYMTDPLGLIVCQADYPKAVARCSWARMTDGSEQWGYCNKPTPEATNDTLSFTPKRLDAPIVSHDSRVFVSSFSLKVEIPEGATLRFTTDGSTPTATHGRTSTTGTFTISKSCVYRLCLVSEEKMASPVVTRTFIRKDRNFTIPILCITTDPNNLYSNDMGVFVAGINGRPGKGMTTPCNWNMEWDRPVNVEYIDTDGRMLINQEVELSRCGGHSKGFFPMSFKLKADKTYEGRGYMETQFFEDKPHLRTKALQIRNGGNDYECRVRDAFLQSLARTSGIDLDCQDYQPVVHYINGVCKGVINMREPNNKHFVLSNYGLDDDEIDLFEIDCDSAYVQKCGTRQAWEELLELSKNSTDPSVYNQIKERLDIDELCNYMAIEQFLCNTDWPQNNCKGWRPRQEGGRFRFIMYDTDLTFGTDNPFSWFGAREWHTFCPLYGVEASAYTRQVELVPLFLRLLQNEQFRRHYIDTFCLVAGSVYEPNRCKSLIEEWATRVDKLQQMSDNGYDRNVSPWASANDLISKLTNQSANMYYLLKRYDKLQLSNTDNQHISITSNTEGARLSVNGQEIPLAKFDGQLFPPAVLKAWPVAGHRFVGWEQTGGSQIGKSSTILEDSTTWYYYDRGGLDNADWKALDYSLTRWKSGRAPFGYSNSYSFPTKLNYGTDASKKYITYYFRKNVRLASAPSSNDVFCLNYKIDDGFVIYVNGKEAGRYNIPDGEPNSKTLASTPAPTDPFEGTIQLNTKLFQEGTNVIAVEVHQNSEGSTDIYWDASISWTSYSDKPLVEPQMVCMEDEMILPQAKGKIELMAVYEPLDAGLTGAPVRVNEVSASNSVCVNEWNKKADWVELYNTTDRDIDLSGMYFSDDVTDTRKYRISGQDGTTVLPAHEHIIIWCDKPSPNDTQTQLHAPFKLANEDNKCVILTASNESWADTLAYCRHDGTQSVGRYPDGADALYLMSRPSIEARNRITSYSKAWTPSLDYELIDMLPTQDFAHNGTFCIEPAENGIRLKGEESTTATIRLYTIDGSLVTEQAVELNGGVAEVSFIPLQEGIYMVVATMGTERVNMKVRL